IAGTPKEIVTAYTELTGRPAMPPEWAFGLWASTCFVQFTEASVLEVARPARRGHPLRRLPSGLVLAARLHVVRLRVGLGPPPRSTAPPGRAPSRRVPQLFVDQPLRLAAERALPGGCDARLLPSPARRQRLSPDRLEPAHRARHGALRDRRLHESGGGGMVPRQAHRAAPPRRRFIQARFLRRDSR